MEKAKKCLLADFFCPKVPARPDHLASEAHHARESSHGPGTSEASALSPLQAKNFGLGARSAPRSRGPGTSEASALSPPQANFFLFYCV